MTWTGRDIVMIAAAKSGLYMDQIERAVEAIRKHEPNLLTERFSTKILFEQKEAFDRSLNIFLAPYMAENKARNPEETEFMPN